MTRFALDRYRLIECYRLTVHHLDQAMTFGARNSLMATSQRKLRSLVVVKGRWLPALGAMAAGAVRLALADELLRMQVNVTRLANLWNAFELDLFLSEKCFVTCIASDRSMHAEQRELGFRMVKSADFAPRPCAVAGLATELCPIRPAALHAFTKLSMMRVGMASRTGFVLKAEWNDLGGSSATAHFMAFHAGHGDMRTG